MPAQIDLPYDHVEDARKRRLAQIGLEARAQLEQEQWDAEVQREVRHLRAHSNRSLWQRLLDKLPFTITRRKQ